VEADPIIFSSRSPSERKGGLAVLKEFDEGLDVGLKLGRCSAALWIEPNRFGKRGTSFDRSTPPS